MDSNSTSAAGGRGAGTEVELLSKTLHAEHKMFYFDLKENRHGRYMKISEKRSSKSMRSTIIVPLEGIACFFDVFDYYVTSDDDDEIYSKELHLDSKVVYFDVGENKRGRFLKVSEVAVGGKGGTIIVPEGSRRGEGWSAFRSILDEINEASKPQKTEDKTVVAVALPSDECADGFRAMRADEKRFIFDLGNNSRGHFLKISEVAGSDRSTIILPLSGLKQFHEIVGHFVDLTKDRIQLQEMNGASV